MLKNLIPLLKTLYLMFSLKSKDRRQDESLRTKNLKP